MSLSAQHLAICQAAMTLVVTSDFYDDWEFELLFPASREHIARVLEGWPGNAADPHALRIASACVGMLTGYPMTRSQRQIIAARVGSDDVLDDVLERIRFREAELSSGTTAEDTRPA